MRLIKKKEKKLIESKYANFLKSKRFIHKDYDEPVYTIKDIIEGNSIISWNETSKKDVKYPVQKCISNFKNGIWLFVK